jgi:hypothetical protein
MRLRTVIVCSLTAILLSGIPSHGQSAKPKNPGIFQGYAVQPSAYLGFLASEDGKQMLLHSPNPSSYKLLKRFHPDFASQWPQKPILQAPAPLKPPLGIKSVPAPPMIGFQPAAVTVNTTCGAASGHIFNLESSMTPVYQGTPSVDFWLNGAGTTTAPVDVVMETGLDDRGPYGTFSSEDAIYVHRLGTTSACIPDFEMENPPITHPFASLDSSLSPIDGMPTARVLFDPINKRFILADLRVDDVAGGIGLRRITGTNLTSTTLCPAGTLTDTQAATCAGTTGIIIDPSLTDIPDSVSIAQDPRTAASGVLGPGDIYVANTSFGDEYRTVIHLIACKAAFATPADCSTPLIISRIQNSTGFPSVSVVPSGPNVGHITVAYVNNGDIWFVHCTPKGAPAAPSCTAPVQVNKFGTTISPISFPSRLSDNPGLNLSLAPIIINRPDSTTGQTTFVVWTQCKSATYGTCADSDIVMATATSLTAPVWTARNVTTAAGHQFQPGISWDSGQNIVTIAYYAATDTYKDRTIVQMQQILPGSTTPGTAVNVTTSATMTSSNLLEGSYFSYTSDPLGLAAHGGSAAGSTRLYVGHVNSSRLGTYAVSASTPSGIQNPEANNHISLVTY